MSVLTIAQNVARSTGFTAPSTLVGSSDEVAVQLLQLIDDETRGLAEDYDWQILITPEQFNFVDGQDDYDVPLDFERYIPKTIWNSTTRRPLIAPINAEDYQIQKNYLITSAIDNMVFFSQDGLTITPTPTSTDSINYLYITTDIYADNLGVRKDEITADTDSPLISESLIQSAVKLAFLVSKGLIDPNELEKSREYKDFNKRLEKAVLNDGFGSKNPINMNSGGSAYWLAAYTQDSDFPAS